MTTEKTHDEPVLITPRMARDSGKYRFELHEQFLVTRRMGSSLLFDVTGEIEGKLKKGNFDVENLESELWDLIKNTFTGSGIGEERLKTVTELFNFSSTLCSIFTLADPMRFDLLKDNSLCSFALSPSVQKQIIDYLRSPKTPTNYKEYESTARMKFWSCMIMIIQSNTCDIDAFRAGLMQELVELLKAEPYGKLIEILMQFPIKLTLRCSEEVVANILDPENEENLQELLELKYLQIISGYGLDTEELREKFVHLKDLGFYK